MFPLLLLLVFPTMSVHLGCATCPGNSADAFSSGNGDGDGDCKRDGITAACPSDRRIVPATGHTAVPHCSLFLLVVVSIAVAVHHHGESRRGDADAPARRLRGGVSSRREAAAGGHRRTVNNNNNNNGGGGSSRFITVIALTAAAMCRRCMRRLEEADCLGEQPCVCRPELSVSRCAERADDLPRLRHRERCGRRRHQRPRGPRGIG